MSKTFWRARVVETYAPCRRAGFWHSALKHVSAQQYADQGRHRYYTVVESRPLQSGKVARQMLYLGEINDSQQAASRKTLEVFDEAAQRLTPL